MIEISEELRVVGKVGLRVESTNFFAKNEWLWCKNLFLHFKYRFTGSQFNIE